MRSQFLPPRSVQQSDSVQKNEKTTKSKRLKISTRSQKCRGRIKNPNLDTRNEDNTKPNKNTKLKEERITNTKGKCTNEKLCSPVHEGLQDSKDSLAKPPPQTDNSGGQYDVNELGKIRAKPSIVGKENDPFIIEITDNPVPLAYNLANEGLDLAEVVTSIASFPSLLGLENTFKTLLLSPSLEATAYDLEEIMMPKTVSFINESDSMHGSPSSYSFCKMMGDIIQTTWPLKHDIKALSTQFSSMRCNTSLLITVDDVMPSCMKNKMENHVTDSPKQISQMGPTSWAKTIESSFISSDNPHEKVISDREYCFQGREINDNLVWVPTPGEGSYMDSEVHKRLLESGPCPISLLRRLLFT